MITLGKDIQIVQSDERYARRAIHKSITFEEYAFLLDKVKVATVPGIEFGLEGFLRISTCGTIKEITEGIARIKWALDPNSPNELFIGNRKLVRDWL